MKTKYQYQTPEEYMAYLEGYYDGMSDYAVWKDGKQYVGIQKKPLSEIWDSIRAELMEAARTVKEQAQ